MTKKNISSLPNSFDKTQSGSIPLKENDDLTKKLFMLFEYYNTDITVKDIVKKYKISRAGFYVIKNLFEKRGSAGLIKKKTGPKHNYVRTESIKNLVIRLKYLDPYLSGAVIAQKLNQQGHKISIKSVERIISELKLVKKTSITRQKI
jgi:transposase